MRFFFLFGEYASSFEALAESAELLDEHRAFVSEKYDSGEFLFSGPGIPSAGGVLVARARSRTELDRLMAQEPFVREGKVAITQVIEFQPAKYQPSLSEWFGGELHPQGQAPVLQPLPTLEGK